MREQRKYIA